MASNKVERRIQGHLTDYDQDYLMCRFRRHRWDWEGFYRSRHDGHRYIVSVSVCDSCSMRREDTLDSTGALVGRHYSHPEGYLFKYDEEERAERRRVGITDIVRTMYKRVDIFESEDDLLAQRR